MDSRGGERRERDASVTDPCRHGVKPETGVPDPGGDAILRKVPAPSLAERSMIPTNDP